MATIRKIFILIMGVMLMTALFACGRPKYKLNFDGYGFESKKSEYAAGEKVKVRYDIIATDTDYSFSIDDDVDMKQDFDGGYVFTFKMPPHDVTMHVSSRNSMEYIPYNEIWPYYEEPVSLRYDRKWEYGASAETDDPELIYSLTQDLRWIVVGDPTDMAVEDYTDILTFTFADGREVRVVFEADIWVDDNGDRFEVIGLENVRSKLDRLIGEEE